MASYTRIGSFLSASELAVDPFGKIHRGLSIAGSSYERHCLLRTFSEELMSAGLGQKLEEATRNATFLSGTRGFGGNYHIEGGKHPVVSCDYIPGRNLAQMIDKAKHEQIPLGVDHALSVLQGLAQALITLHSKGIHHGTLSPNSIWVSFEGAAYILDAPYAAVVGSLLPKCPIASASLARYRPTASSALHLDLYSLGAILYELLTFDKLPSQDLIAPTLAKATLKAAQEDAPIPPEIVELLKRLLLVGKPFESPSAFNAELETVLYDGDYSPTTFNMAFFMHTLFREENDHDNQAMKADQAADFSPFVNTDAGGNQVVQNSNMGTVIKWVAMLIGVVILGGAAVGFAYYRKNKEMEKLQAELADVQTKFTEMQMKMADLGRQESAVVQRQVELEKKKAEAKTADERAKIERDLAEAKRKQEEIQKAKQDVKRTQEELSTRTASIAQLVTPGTVQPRPEPPPPPVVTTPQQAPPPVQTSPTPPPAVQLQPKPEPAPVTAPSPTLSSSFETPPACTNQARASAPRVAFLPPHLRNKEFAVVVKVFVDAQGRPSRAIVASGIEGLPAYNDSARQAAMESSFTPGQKDGKAISGWVTLNYYFKTGAR